MDTRAFAIALLCATPLLAGCASGPETTSTTTAGEIVITKPGDYGQDNATNGDLPHRHDYWGGQQSVVVMDGWPTQPGPGVAAGNDVPIYEYRPSSGNVVPQGAGQVTVRMDWTPASDDIYTDPQLWVKGAADNQPVFVAHIEPGQTVTVNTTDAQNDLPHQLLSAWMFQFRLSEGSAGGAFPMLRFKANVTVHVEAIRGTDPIPLYPGHPDRWNGTDVITLVDVNRQQFYLQDPGDAGCDGFSCPVVEQPRNGTIVPPDASSVQAILTVEAGSPQTIGLSYHGAEGRSFARLQPESTNGNVRTYRIPVGQYGDGPYAKQSQWEFATFVDGPAPDTAVVENFHLLVTVHKGV